MEPQARSESRGESVRRAGDRSARCSQTSACMRATYRTHTRGCRYAVMPLYYRYAGWTVPHQDKPTRVPSPVWVCVCCVSVVCEHAQRCVTAECGARGPEVYVEHASAGLGRAR
eukprot:269653-Prymnesium_polylepis.1